MIRRLYCHTPCQVQACAVRQDRVGSLSEICFMNQKRSLVRSTVACAKPNAKLPERTVRVLCAACRTPLYKYHKNGNGKLVKCWHERIAEDYTNKDLKCPQCGQQFARETMVRGLPANKIIGGKVILKR